MPASRDGIYKGYVRLGEQKCQGRTVIEFLWKRKWLRKANKSEIQILYTIPDSRSVRHVSLRAACRPFWYPSINYHPQIFSFIYLKSNFRKIHQFRLLKINIIICRTSQNYLLFAKLIVHFYFILVGLVEFQLKVSARVREWYLSTFMSIMKNSIFSLLLGLGVPKKCSPTYWLRLLSFRS